jgi:Kazal-type serine protease inhibitor domain
VEEVFVMRAKAILYVALGLSLLTSLGMEGTVLAQTCGGIGALKCPAGKACNYPEGQCNAPDLAGKCVPVAKVCPKAGRKVCGCDGVTYANKCELLKAGVREAKKGSCDKPSGKKGKAAAAADHPGASPRSR